MKPVVSSLSLVILSSTGHENAPGIFSTPREKENLHPKFSKIYFLNCVLLIHQHRPFIRWCGNKIPYLTPLFYSLSPSSIHRIVRLNTIVVLLIVHFRCSMNFSERKFSPDGSGRRRRNLAFQSPCYVRVVTSFSSLSLVPIFFICLITKVCEGY